MKKQTINNLAIATSILVGATCIMNKQIKRLRNSQSNINNQNEEERKYTMIHQVPLKKYILLHEISNKMKPSNNLRKANEIELDVIEDNSNNVRTFYELPYQYQKHLTPTSNKQAM